MRASFPVRGFRICARTTSHVAVKSATTRTKDEGAFPRVDREPTTLTPTPSEARKPQEYGIGGCRVQSLSGRASSNLTENDLAARHAALLGRSTIDRRRQ